MHFFFNFLFIFLGGVGGGGGVGLVVEVLGDKIGSCRCLVH